MERLSAAGVQHLLRTDIDGNIVITSSGGDDYTFQTSRSNKSVAVPEFEVAIAIFGISFLAVILTRARVWKILRQA